jgi:hypothetical protein
MSLYDDIEDNIFDFTNLSIRENSISDDFDTKASIKTSSIIDEFDEYAEIGSRRKTSILEILHKNSIS